jgi:hypothetical protein
MTLTAGLCLTPVLTLLAIAAVAASDDNRIRALFEGGVKDTGQHGHVPVYVPTILPKDLLTSATMVVRGSGTGTGYDLSLFHDDESGYAGLMASFLGSQAGATDPLESRHSKPVPLANGTKARYRPMSCGGSCAPASLSWRTGTAEYTIQLKLNSRLTEEQQIAALLEVANTMVLSSKQ